MNDHLLGLYDFMSHVEDVDLEEDEDYEQFRDETLRKRFEKKMDEVEEEEDDTPENDLEQDENGLVEDFDFSKYKKSHHLNSMVEFSDYAKEKNLTMRTIPVIMEIEILNNGSQFSEDKLNMAVLYAILLVVFAALAALNFKKYQEDLQRFQEEGTPLSFTFGSLNMIVLHCILKCIHNYYYA
mmetsp:Transcript_13184/g.20535  ORF Transcript_13184/g.20535 Transcript_13184/m.20535 type:complete len:183 (+) Transcript_13184:761-1309(+)